MIHLGTHAHAIVNNKCKESFKEMKNMVVEEVCCMPVSTTLAITLFTSKTFLSRHLFNEDGEGPVEVLKSKN